MNETADSLDISLEPADNTRLANLCGQFDEHLRQIERRLGVEINNRGNSFRIIGDTESVRATAGVLQDLYKVSASETLSPNRVHLYLQESGIEALLEEEVDVAEVIIRTKRGVVKGRGPNQKKYLHNIVTHDINFGIGPAGTGKTYLAVACAVEALEKDQVRKVVLTRPAVEAGERLGFLPGDLAQKAILIFARFTTRSMKCSVLKRSPN